MAKTTVQRLKRVYVSQTEIPKHSLVEAVTLAQSLQDNFAGKNAPPHQLAGALDISPTSSRWQSLSGAAVAYGLTDGGYNANDISLTQLGRRIVAAEIEGDDAQAKLEAALKPGIMRKFFTKYNRAKLPPEKIAFNVLGSMGVPPDRIVDVFNTIKSNGEHVGIIQTTKTGPFVAVDAPLLAVATAPAEPQTEEKIQDESPSDNGEHKNGAVVPPESPASKAVPKNTRVFITHGKNRDIVQQIKELLVFGKFDPVITIEHETISKPVPDKVMDDMRSCFAGVIHVDAEDELLDSTGATHHKINENVLIEIGAAMALYKNNFVLLVGKGIHLPSNLQGLYVCHYEGVKLDYEATMKLLKAFNEFK
ncbi:MAG: TIR domain-containing protein [Limisphaerales bacterium]